MNRADKALLQQIENHNFMIFEIQVDLNREYDSMMCKQLLLLLSKLSTDMMDIKLNQYEIKLQLSEMAVAISDTRAKLAKLSET